MAWTEERKQLAVDRYLELDPTEATSTELVKAVADELGESPNGVRQVLIQAKVYVKKDPTAAPTKTTTTTKTGEGTKRVSKESQIDALKEAILAKGKEVDEDIVSKLTGKAAAYFADLLKVE